MMSDASFDKPIVISVCFIQHDANQICNLRNELARSQGECNSALLRHISPTKRAKSAPHHHHARERRRGDETKCTKKPFGILPRAIALLFHPSAAVGASDA